MNTNVGGLGHRVLRASVGAVGGLIGLAAVRFSLPAGTPRIRSGGRPGSARSVAELEKVHIGGDDQWILERSEDVHNPIVLFLHGGPGTSQLTSNRRNTKALEKFFTVVNWDQRAAGKSYRAIDDVEKMNIDQFVADTHELTTYLLTQYQQDRLILVGHSWGSVVGAMAAAKRPELYHCYVGIGQLANMAEGEALSYQWTLEEARRHGDHRAIETLVGIGPPPYTGDWRAKTVTQRRLLGRFGGEVLASRNGAFGPVITGLLFSKEYTLADRVNYFRGIVGSMQVLWPQLMEVDLFNSTPEIGVPVLLMEGRHDMECPAEIAERYFQALRAPSKELIWFDKSAHLPNSEQRDLFNALMVQKVLPMAAAHDDG